MIAVAKIYISKHTGIWRLLVDRDICPQLNPVAKIYISEHTGIYRLLADSSGEDQHQ